METTVLYNRPDIDIDAISNKLQSKDVLRSHVDITVFNRYDIKKYIFQKTIYDTKYVFLIDTNVLLSILSSEHRNMSMEMRQLVL